MKEMRTLNRFHQIPFNTRLVEGNSLLNKNYGYFQYGQNDNKKSFLLEISWNEDYPTEKPTINMDTFYNNHIKKALKEKISNLVSAQAEQYLGTCMTYSLFEFVKEEFDELIKDQPEETTEEREDSEKVIPLQTNVRLVDK